MIIAIQLSGKVCNMKKKVTLFLAGVAAVLAMFLFINGKNTSHDREIKHFTAFFTTEGTTIDGNNEIKGRIAQLTGADCEEIWLVGQTKENALNGYIASGEYPDFISGETMLYEAGALIALDEYWDKYPNIRNYLTQEQWERFRQKDGHIYWIPQFGVSKEEDVEVIHNGEAFWIQTRVLKWAGYPEIHTVDQYFDLLERYVEANPVMADGTENVPFSILCDGWRYFCLENVPQFLDGYPNDGCCIVRPDSLQVVDYNTTDTAKRYFAKLNEEYHKGILNPEAFTSTYEEYLKELSSGAVLGMIDQWWEFYYTIQPIYEENHLNEQGCDYVPLPITMEEGIENQWHTVRSAEIDNSSGLSVTVSCEDIDGALQFVNDLLEPEIEKLRFWGEEGIDYSVGEDGVFYMTEEQGKRRGEYELSQNHYCPYSYFPRVEGLLPDGINAFSMEYQSEEFLKNQPADVQECFEAYGVTNYVELLGNHEAPGVWYPMYSYNTALPADTPAGQTRARLDEVKHIWLPQIIMAQDYEAAWQEYMAAYEACSPEIYYTALQEELEKRTKQ